LECPMIARLETCIFTFYMLSLKMLQRDLLCSLVIQPVRHRIPTCNESQKNMEKAVEICYNQDKRGMYFLQKRKLILHIL